MIPFAVSNNNSWTLHVKICNKISQMEAIHPLFRINVQVHPERGPVLVSSECHFLLCSSDKILKDSPIMRLSLWCFCQTRSGLAVVASPVDVVLLKWAGVSFLGTGARGAADVSVVWVNAESGLNHHHAVIIVVAAPWICKGKDRVESSVIH